MTTDIKYQAFLLLLATDIQDMDIQQFWRCPFKTLDFGNINFVITTQLVKYEFSTKVLISEPKTLESEVKILQYPNKRRHRTDKKHSTQGLV